jgi:hypothetical protein
MLTWCRLYPRQSLHSSTVMSILDQRNQSPLFTSLPRTGAAGAMVGWLEGGRIDGSLLPSDQESDCVMVSESGISRPLRCMHLLFTLVYARTRHTRPLDKSQLESHCCVSVLAN